jgi:hypothetical protein
MLYSKQLQVDGWTDEHIERLEKLLWVHAIRAEEFYGLAFCTENLEYSIHVGNEIRRHSSMDNYSCELFERAILTHKAQKHNAKGLEKTFATRENMRNFLSDYQETNGPFSTYDLHKTPYKFKVDDATPPYFLQESSFDAAKVLLQDLQQHKHLPAINHAMSYGVAIGSVRRKVFPVSVVTDLQRFFNRQGVNVQDIPNIHDSLSSVAITDDNGEVMKVHNGCTCKVLSENGQEEWTIEISEMFAVGPVDGKYYTFVNGTYFVPTLNNGNIMYHQWTKTAQIIPRTYVRDSIQPTNRIKRKVIIYPEPTNIEEPRYFLCMDLRKLDLEMDVKVPVYPRMDKNVSIKGTGNEVWFGLLKQVNSEAKRARVQWYQETQRPRFWTLTNLEDDIYFASIINICNVKRTFGGYNIT